MQSLNILFTGKDQVEVSEEPLKEMGPNDFLVRSSKSLISTGTESISLSRLFDPGTHWDAWVTYPFHPGYSLIGQVVAVGKNVNTVRKGERIALRYSHRQYAVVPDTEPIYHIPDSVSDEDAAWFHMATIVQIGVRRAEHTLGDAVVVVGLGLLGQLVVQYVRLLGARYIIGIDIAERRLKMAQAHGATTVLTMDVEQAREEVLRVTEGAGANVVYDVTGAAGVFSQALRLLRPKGRMVLLGDTGFPERQHLTTDVILNGLSIVGAHDMHGEFPATDSSFWNNVRQGELFLNFLQRGEMRVQDMITHRYTPLAASEAYSMLRKERATAMGVIFDWTQLT